MTRSSVVLPQPDGPISETNSPRRMLRSMPDSASTGPSLVVKVKPTMLDVDDGVVDDRGRQRSGSGSGSGSGALVDNRHGSRERLRRLVDNRRSRFDRCRRTWRPCRPRRPRHRGRPWRKRAQRRGGGHRRHRLGGFDDLRFDDLGFHDLRVGRPAFVIHGGNDLGIDNLGIDDFHVDGVSGLLCRSHGLGGRGGILGRRFLGLRREDRARRASSQKLGERTGRLGILVGHASSLTPPPGCSWPNARPAAAWSAPSRTTAPG